MSMKQYLCNFCYLVKESSQKNTLVIKSTCKLHFSVKNQNCIYMYIVLNINPKNLACCSKLEMKILNMLKGADKNSVTILHLILIFTVSNKYSVISKQKVE